MKELSLGIAIFLNPTIIQVLIKILYPAEYNILKTYTMIPRTITLLHG